MQRHRSFLAALAVAAAALALAVPARPAAAVDGPEFRFLAAPGTADKTQAYGPMPVNDAGSVFTDDPETCRQVPWCTLVPLTIDLPKGYDHDVNEFVLTMTVNWNDASVGGEAQGNDLDTYYYDLSGKKPKEVGRSAGSTAPEVTKLFQPDHRKYAIVVYNFLGVNSGFTVSAHFTDVSITGFDQGDTGPAPAVRPGGGGTGGTVAPSGPPPAGAPIASPPAAPAPGPAGGGDVGLTTGGGLNAGALDTPAAIVSGDSDFAGIGTGTETAGSTRTVKDLFGTTGRTAGPLRDVPPLVLILWLGVAPLALLGATFLWLRSHRPAALAMTFATPPPPESLTTDPTLSGA